MLQHQPGKGLHAEAQVGLVLNQDQCKWGLGFLCALDDLAF